MSSVVRIPLDKFPKNYVTAKGAKNYLKKIYNRDFSSIPDSTINKILISSTVFDGSEDRKFVKNPKPNKKPIPVYYIGLFNALIKNSHNDEYGIMVTELAETINKYTNMNIEFKNHNNSPENMEEPEEEPWDETNMDYVRWQLDQHINDSKIPRKITITEDQLKKLLKIIK